MITLLAKLRILEEMEPAFEEAFAKLAAKVRDIEPGTKLYKLAKVRAAKSLYQVIEFYESAEALETHSRNPDTKGLIAEMGQYLAEPPNITIVDDLDI